MQEATSYQTIGGIFSLRVTALSWSNSVAMTPYQICDRVKDFKNSHRHLLLQQIKVCGGLSFIRPLAQKTSTFVIFYHNLSRHFCGQVSADVQLEYI